MDPEQAKWIRFNELLVDYDIYGGPREVALLRRGAPQILVEAVNAGLIAEASADSSIDKIRETNASVVSQPPDRDYNVEVFHELLKAALTHVSWALARFVKDDSRTPILGVRLADVCLRRLRSSMARAGFLYSIGGLFEGNAICRQILEQQAWAFCISPIANWDSAAKVLPTKSVTKLKRVIPNLGEIYGRLSSLSHLNTEVQILLVTESDTGPKIFDSFAEESLIQVVNLLYLADVFAVVFEFTQRDWLPKLACWDRKGGQLTLNQNRPIPIVRPEMMEVLNELSKTVRERRRPAPWPSRN